MKMIGRVWGPWDAALELVLHVFHPEPQQGVNMCWNTVARWLSRPQIILISIVIDIGKKLHADTFPWWHSVHARALSLSLSHARALTHTHAQAHAHTHTHAHARARAHTRVDSCFMFCNPFAEVTKEWGFFAVKWPYVLAVGFYSCVTYTEWF
jgi:hypothetical protein